MKRSAIFVLLFAVVAGIGSFGCGSGTSSSDSSKTTPEPEKPKSPFDSTYKSVDTSKNGSTLEDVIIKRSPDYLPSNTNGTCTKIINVSESQIKNKVYASPTGTASGNGSKSNPYDFETAIKKVVPGGAIVLLEGTYAYSDRTVTISKGNNGTQSKRKYILPADGAKVVLDFSGQPYNSEDTSKNLKGFRVHGDWWHIYNIEVKGAAAHGIYVGGNNNIIEQCKTHGNRETGFNLCRGSGTYNFSEWPTDNLILNCTSFDNFDPATGENADGFGAKIYLGKGNVFDGCISYNNCDDGWDLFAKPDGGSIGAVIIRNSVAFRNGETTDGNFTDNSDGNGFKLGGGYIGSGHVVENCVSFENKADGFTDNNNPAFSALVNCTSYKNGHALLFSSTGTLIYHQNFFMNKVDNDYALYKNLISFEGAPKNSDRFVGLGQKILYYANDKKYHFEENETIFIKDYKNSPVAQPTAEELFESSTMPELKSDFHKIWRNPDGTINMKGFLEPKRNGKYAGMGAKFGTKADVVLDISLELE